MTLKSLSTSSFKIPKALIVFLILFTFLHIVDYVSHDTRYSHEKIYKIFNGKINADILIVGSSRAVNHYDTSVINNKTNKKTYNIGMNGGGVSEQLFLLKNYLQNNKNPHTIIINLDSTSINEEQMGGSFDLNKYERFFRHKNIFEIYKAKRPLRAYIVKYIPFIYKNKYLKTFIVNKIKGKPFPHNNGYIGISELGKYDKKHDKKLVITSKPESEDILKKIIKLSRTSSEHTIGIFSPQLDIYNTNEEDVIEYLKEITNKSGICFYNYSDFYKNKELFYDAMHLNHKGAEMFTKEILTPINTLCAKKETVGLPIGSKYLRSNLVKKE